MAQATVKTVQFLDPRIEPQPDPVYDYVIAPTQNQYYKIPASGLSNSSITFNNLTTLGADRAYLDTFEIEITAVIRFETNKESIIWTGGSGAGEASNATKTAFNSIYPSVADWTFDSFPFNKCVEQARVNVNGGAFFSEPLSYLRAKEHYMKQSKLSECYENICPIHRPLGQTESGRYYDKIVSANNALYLTERSTNGPVNNNNVPSRIPKIALFSHFQSDQGFTGYNNSIITLGNGLSSIPNEGPSANSNDIFFQNSSADVVDRRYTCYRVTWREPVFVSPFSSRYDATYGRPLYNITSLDFAFNLQNLGNMIRLVNTTAEASPGAAEQPNYHNLWTANPPVLAVKGYTIDIQAANLCYQVLTIPPIMTKPLTTLVPYRRFVPYITDYTIVDNTQTTGPFPVTGGTMRIRSGVYTMNEIPTAIWVFAAPSKAVLQTNEMDYVRDGNATTTAFGNWDTNKQFAFMRHISISMANTTQILDQATPYDLYRIAKANGCDDSYSSWAAWNSVAPVPNAYNRRTVAGTANAATSVEKYGINHIGCGSVLRLKPGVDLIVPDQALIPGANANNMVIQVEGEFYVPPHSAANGRYALWLIFEYVGVAAISSGQCEITMNPLGSGEVMSVSPVMSATSEETEGELEGSGVWDRVQRKARIAAQVAQDGVISKLLKRLPGAVGDKVAAWAQTHGLGAKRPRSETSGGAVMGRGMDEWI